MRRKNIQELHNEFMNESRFVQHLAPATLRSYEASFNLFIKLMPETDLKTLCSATLTEFFKKLDERERIVGRGIVKKGVKSSTIATYRSKLSVFFEWLRIKGYIESNPFVGIKFPSVKYEDRKFLKKDEVERIFAAVALNINWRNNLIKKRNILIFYILLYCGLRRGELIGLTLDAIDLENRCLTVRPETSKMRRELTISLNTKVIQVLKDYLIERRRLKYKTPYLLVSNNRDDRFTKDGLKHLVKKVVAEAGVKFHVHRFRHTFAVNLLNQKTDISVVKQALGHVDIRMTAGYLRSLPQKVITSAVESLSLDGLV